MRHANQAAPAKSLLNFAILLVVILAFAENAPAQDTSSGLFGKTWTLTEMEGRHFSADKPNLEFNRDTKRVSGSGGCNRFSGTFEIDGSRLKFSPIVSTKMACLAADVQRTETSFFQLLETTTRFEVEGNTLRLYAGDSPILVFVDWAAKSETGATPKAIELVGTPWQLVKFQGRDDQTVTPDDKSKYTLVFGNDGRVAVRLDCNRGSAAWKSHPPNHLHFGPLLLTRATCPPGSLHDRIANDWSAVQSYVIKDGHLFLSLTAGGGSYEFEPAGGSQPTTSALQSKTSLEDRVEGTIL